MAADTLSKSELKEQATAEGQPRIVVEEDGGSSEPEVPRLSGNAGSDQNHATPPPQKGWFSHVFFLTTVCLAMGLAAFNSWIGPDKPIDGRDFWAEDQEQRQVMLDKLQWRLRRADLFRDPQQIYAARCNLASALVFKGDLDKAIGLLQEATDRRLKTTPCDQGFALLLELYQATQQNQQAAELVKTWKHKMPADYYIAFDLVPFYETAAQVNERAGEFVEASKYRNLAEQSRLIPRDFYMPLNSKTNFTLAAKAASPSYALACHQILKGDFGTAHGILEKIIADDQEGKTLDNLRARVMLPVVGVESAGNPYLQKEFDEAFAAINKLKVYRGGADAYKAVLYHSYAKFRKWDGKGKRAAMDTAMFTANENQLRHKIHQDSASYEPAVWSKAGD